MKIILSEPDLIKAIIDRDRAGAVALYDNYALILFKVIYCSVKDKQGAEAILEKAILKIWNTIELYELQNDSFLTWAAGTARSLAKEAFQPGSPVGERIGHNLPEPIQLPEKPQI